MQSFEVERWVAARQAFAEAFARGYARAKAEIVAGIATQNGETQSAFPVDVPRDTIVDGDWGVHVVLFESAGRAAALARRRQGEAELALLHDPDHREASFTGRCRWVVMF